MEKILELLMENPETILPIIKVYIDKYKPLVYGILKEFDNICVDYSNNKEYPATLAKIKKNMYDAYVNVGFSEEQALALMLNDNLQLVKNINRISKSTNKIDK